MGYKRTRVDTRSLDRFAKNINSLIEPVGGVVSKLKTMTLVQPGALYHADEIRAKINGDNGRGGLRESYISVCTDLGNALADLHGAILDGRATGMHDRPETAGGRLDAGDTANPSPHGEYATWDWRQIKAAILGGADGAKRVADPRTLVSAGYTFYDVQSTLHMVGLSIIDQANALAGSEHAPWRGDAADAFMNTMTTFSNQVLAIAASLAGGPTGAHSVPDQLVTSGNHLAWAQAQIESIYSYYGAAALNTSNASMMTDNMRVVLDKLVSSYQVTVDSVKAPAPVRSPAGGPDIDIRPPAGVNVPPPSNLPPMRWRTLRHLTR